MATRRRSSSRSKSRNQSLSQFVVGTAALGLPAPVRDVASTPWGSRLVLIIGGLALASGVLTVSWDGTVPSIKVNHDRAQQVRQEIASELQVQTQQLTGRFGTGQNGGGQPNSAQANFGQQNSGQPNFGQQNPGTSNAWQASSEQYNSGNNQYNSGNNQNNPGTSAWSNSAPSNAQNYAPYQPNQPAPNYDSSSNYSNSAQSRIGDPAKTAPGPNAFRQQAEGAYRQVQDTIRQAQEQVENSPLFAPRTKVTR